MVSGADRLAQVVSNLLANARAHGQLGEPINVTFEAAGKQVFLVVNNVAGLLGQDAVRNLYTPFKHAGQNQPRNRGGMRLGRYIVDRIVAGPDGIIACSHAGGRVDFTVTLAQACKASTFLQYALNPGRSANQVTWLHSSKTAARQRASR